MQYFTIYHSILSQALLALQKEQVHGTRCKRLRGGQAGDLRTVFSAVGLMRDGSSGDRLGFGTSAS